MHYYKRNLGDYAKKAGRLSMLQHGSYTLLIDACYDREQFPTMDEAIEWTWASTTEEIEAVQFVLRKFFIPENGVYVQTRIREELEEYRQKAETNRRIATERETNRKAKSTNRAPVVNEPPPNHKPLTINQEPLTNIKTPTAPSEKTARSTPKEKIDFQDGKFTNADRRLDLWREAYPAVNIQSEMAKAAAWLLANPKNAKQNHERFLTNWLARAQEKAPAQGGANDPIYQSLVEKFGSAKRRPDGRIYAGGRIFNADGSGGLCL